MRKCIYLLHRATYNFFPTMPSNRTIRERNRCTLMHNQRIGPFTKKRMIISLRLFFVQRKRKKEQSKSFANLRRVTVSKQAFKVMSDNQVIKRYNDKSLVQPRNLQYPSSICFQSSRYSKMEKADILEMTVKYLRQIQYETRARKGKQPNSLVLALFCFVLFCLSSSFRRTISLHLSNICLCFL